MLWSIIVDLAIKIWCKHWVGWPEEVFMFLLVPPPKCSCSCPSYSAQRGLPYAFDSDKGLCFCCCFRTLRYLYSVHPPYPAPHWHLGLLCGVSMPTLTPGSSPNWPANISWWENMRGKKKYKANNKKLSHLSTYVSVISEDTKQSAVYRYKVA